MMQPHRQQSPANSEGSSVESWINVNTANTNHHRGHGSVCKRPKGPSEPPMLGDHHHLTPRGASIVPPQTPAHQIHLPTRHLNNNSKLVDQGDEEHEIQQQMPFHGMMTLPWPHAAAAAFPGGFNFFYPQQDHISSHLPPFKPQGLAGGEQQEPLHHQPASSDLPAIGQQGEQHPAQDPLANMLSLLIDSTSLSPGDDDSSGSSSNSNTKHPVSAFVDDRVRACCATERHALIRGHADCLVSYHRAAEHWQLAREVRGRYLDDVNLNAGSLQSRRNGDRPRAPSPPTSMGTTKPPGPNTTRNSAPHFHHHHPFGVIGERSGADFAAHTLPSPDTPPAALSARHTAPHGGFAGVAMAATPCHGRSQMGAGGARFGPMAAGEFRPMISVAQGTQKQMYNNMLDPTTTDVTRHPLHPLAGAVAAATHEEERVALGYSPRYQGNIYLAANRCADIPDALNTSLFLIHLPPTTTTAHLLAAVHALGPTGRVFAVHINAPEPGRGNPGCAAKVVFFTRAAAHLFFERCQRLGFYVGGRRAHVTWNRIKTAERPELVASDASRVLLITGPRAFVNPRTLTAFFRTKLEFQIDEVLVFDEPGNKRTPSQLPSPPERKDHQVAGGSSSSSDDDDDDDGDAVVEYRFGSFRCQAQAAQMAISRMLPHVRCFFGQDPLAPEAWRRDEYTRRTCESYSEAGVLNALHLG